MVVRRNLLLAWLAITLMALAPVFAYAHIHIGANGEIIEDCAADEPVDTDAERDHSDSNKRAAPHCPYCPGFSAGAALARRLDDAEIWTLIQYLRVLSESRMARTLTNRVGPFLPLTAPDFSFEDAPGAQETLRQLAGREVLLVFGTLPQSLPRLQQLELQRAELTKAGIRVILIAPSDGARPYDEQPMSGVPRLAQVDSDVTETFAMFECPSAISCARPTPSHVEWLIDGGGYVRAR